MDELNDNHFITKVEEAPAPVLALKQVINPIQIVGKVVPITERTYDVQCGNCTEQLQFNLVHVHKTYSSWWSYLRGTFDLFYVKCPVCDSQVDVKGLPHWVLRKV